MKLIKTILFFLLTVSLKAQAIYYVSNTGNNSNSGTSTGAPFLTIAKALSVVVDGDYIRLKGGDTWNESFSVPVANLHFESYGTGNGTLNAFTTVTGFTEDSTNVWSAALPVGVPPKLKLVLVSDTIAVKCRFPNNGFFTTSASAASWIKNSDKNRDTSTYSGAEAVVKTTSWILDVVKVRQHSGDTLYFNDTLSKPGFQFGGNGFFLQNHPAFLNTPGKYYYDSANQRIAVYSVGTPSVKVATKDTLIFISKKDAVSFTNINFTGANNTCIQQDTSRGVSFTNCNFYDANTAIVGMKDNKFSFQGSTVARMLDNGVTMWPSKQGVYIPASPTTNKSDTCIVYNNSFRRIGYWEGMGNSGNVHYEGLILIGDSNRVTNNVIDSTGYSGFLFGGENYDVSYNYIKNFCFNKTDGAGIYCGLGGAISNTGALVKYNIVLNGIGNSKGLTAGTSASAAGIYADDDNKNVTVDNNTIAFCNVNALLMHNNDSCTITNNTVINDSRGDALALAKNIASMTGFVIKGNILFINDSTKYAYWANTVVSNFGISDSNYIVRPLKDSGSMNWNTTGIYGLAGWQATLGKDLNSKITPSPLFSRKNYLLLYNPTMNDSTIVIGGTYFDAKGTIYRKTVTLHAFESALLFEVQPTYISRMKKYGTLIFL